MRRRTFGPPLLTCATVNISMIDELMRCCCVQAIPGMVYSAETKTWRLAGGCAAVDTMPSVSFVMSGTSFSLGPRQYIIQVHNFPFASPHHRTAHAWAFQWQCDRAHPWYCVQSGTLSRSPVRPLMYSYLSGMSPPRPAAQANKWVFADLEMAMQVGAGADTYCMSGIVGNGPEGKVVMGASFLRAYYSVYTYDLVSGNAWVSLAPSAIDTGMDSEGVEITNAAAAAGQQLSASSVFVTPTK